VVDRFAVSSALARDLVVLEAGDGVFGAGAAFAESSAGPVADDAAVGPAAGRGDVRVSAVAAVADESRVRGEGLAEGFAVDEGVVAVPGRASLTATMRRSRARRTIWVLTPRR
jgi:hypothetical protein